MRAHVRLKSQVSEVARPAGAIAQLGTGHQPCDEVISEASESWTGIRPRCSGGSRYTVSEIEAGGGMIAPLLRAIQDEGPTSGSTPCTTRDHPLAAGSQRHRLPPHSGDGGHAGRPLKRHPFCFWTFAGIPRGSQALVLHGT